LSKVLWEENGNISSAGSDDSEDRAVTEDTLDEAKTDA
jgi:hypothetical protein